MILPVNDDSVDDSPELMIVVAVDDGEDLFKAWYRDIFNPHGYVHSHYFVDSLKEAYLAGGEVCK